MRSYLVLVLFISIFSAYISTGNSLKCWLCTTELSIDCANPTTKNTRYEECSTTLSNTKSVCRTIEYLVKRENKIHISRACVEERDGSNNEPCSRVRLQFYPKVEKCNVCSTDLCRPEVVEGTGKSSASNNYAAPVQNHNTVSPPSASTTSQTCIYLLLALVSLSIMLQKINVL